MFPIEFGAGLRSGFAFEGCTMADVLRWGRMGLCMAVLLGVTATATSAFANEAETKGLFLYNLAKYVSWPEGTFAGADDAIVIGVVGDTAFSSGLRALVAGHEAQGRPIEIRDISASEGAAAVHMVYFPAEDMTRLRAQAAPFEKKPVIRVAENKRFAKVGDVGFVLRGGRVQFFVNADNTRRSGLRLGSQIMRLASGVE